MLHPINRKRACSVRYDRLRVIDTDDDGVTVLNNEGPEGLKAWVRGSLVKPLGSLHASLLARDIPVQRKGVMESEIECISCWSACVGN